MRRIIDINNVVGKLFVRPNLMQRFKFVSWRVDQISEICLKLQRKWSKILVNGRKR